MPAKAKLLKIYVGENTRWHGQPLYRAILYKLKEAGLVGVTVYRGVEGYGQQKVVHTTRLLELSADLPMVIESVDTEDKINAVLPIVSPMVTKGLIFTAEVEVHKWSQ